MRHIKKLLVLFLVFNTITSCETEEVSYALQDISAPSDIKAIFDISQDEVGLVTLTPTAQGVSMFEVYFGDVENETPTMVNPGETVSHTYGEGEYNLRIVAVGLTGLKSELVRVVTVSFDPPTDLEVDVAISAANAFELLVTPTATNATVYDVYFGEVEDEEPITIMDTETASYVYAEAGTYTVRVVARGGGAATAEYTEEVTVSGVAECVAETEENIDFANGPINWTFLTDDEDHEFDQFGDISTDIVANPVTDGINSSCFVQMVEKTEGCQTWSGLGQAIPTAIDFTTTDKKIFKLKVLAKDQLANVTLRLEREPFPDADPAEDRVAEITELGVWQELTFDFSDVDDKTFRSIIIYFERDAACDGDVYYFDDLKQTDGASADCVAETEENIDAANGPINWTFKTDDADHEFDAFGDISTDIVANPVTDGINPSCSVQMVEKTEGCQTWSGLGQAIPTAIDFTTTDKKIFKLKVLAKDQLATVTLRLEKEPFPDADPAEDRVAEITELGVWQELTFDFSDVDDKTFRSIIIYFERDAACDGDVYYFDDLKQTDGATADCVAETEENIDAANGPINWTFKTDDADHEFDAFGDISTDIVANPITDGINPSCSVQMVEKTEGCQTWSGLGQAIPTAIDFTTTENKIFKLKVLAKDQLAAVTLRLEKEPFPDADPAEDRVAEITELGVWQELTFDFSDVDDKTFRSIIIYFERDAACDGDVYYFDDLVQTSGNGGDSTGSTNGGGETASGEVANNGGFETGNLDGWAVYKNGGSIDADNTQSNSGDWSGKIVATSPNGLNPTLKQERKAAGSVAVGDVVQITFDYKGSSTGGGTYNMQSFVEAADGVNQTEVFSVTPTDAWQTFTATYTVNSGDVSGGVTMEFTAICGDDSSCNSTLVLDNVSIILNP